MIWLYIKRKIFLMISISVTMIFLYVIFSTFAVPVHAEISTAYQVEGIEEISNWPQQGYNPQRSSYNPNEWELGFFNVDDLEVLWSNSVPCTINSGATVDDGIVYYGHYCGEFRAVDAGSGELIWTRGINSTETSHAVANGIVYVAARCTYSTCGMVYAFDANTGETIWTWEPDAQQPVDILVAENMVYITSQNNKSMQSIVALDAATGTLNWSSKKGGLISIDNGLLYLTSLTDPTTLRVLDAANGRPKWTGVLDGSLVSRPVVAHQQVYVHSNNGYIYTFDSSGCKKKDCMPLWVGLVPGSEGDDPQSPAVDSRYVFVGAGNTFYGFNANGCGEFECAAIWSTATECQFFPGIVTPPSVANGVVYSPCGTNYIYAFDSYTGDILWKYYTSGGYPMRASPAIAEGRLYHAATFDFNLYAFEVQPIVLSPETQTGDVISGEIISYELMLTNNTFQEDRFILDYTGNNWSTALSVTETPPIPNGSSMSITVSVTVPDDAPWFSTDTVMVTASCLTNPTIDSGSAQITTKNYAPPQIGVSPTSLSSTQYPDEIKTQTLTIQNGYGIPLTFDISDGSLFGESILHLHLDENEGSTTFLDSSGFLNHASCTGSYCPVAGVPGRFDKALQFDGLDDYIQHPELVNGQPEGTISLWSKVNSWDPGYAGMYFWSATQYLPGSDSGSDAVNLGAHPGYSDDQIMFGIFQGTWNWAKSGVTPYPGDWYHLAGTWGPEGIKIYVNGELKGTNAYTGPPPTWVNNNLIGSSSWPGTYIDGVIDEVSLYQRAATAPEILDLYMGELKGPWLSINPVSGSVPTNDSIPIMLTFNSTGLQPGLHTTNIYIASNDPDDAIVQVPVVLSVLEP